MPKLALGAGIARGAQAFVQSFTQAKQYADQQEMHKHDIILQAIYSQLQDDNLPYSQRAQLIDSIAPLLKLKLDIPLSHQMGLHQLLDNDVTTQEGSLSTTQNPDTTIQGTVKGQNVQGDINTGAVSDNPSDLTTSITQKGTKSIQYTPTKTEKFGDLSPARYKQLIVQRQKNLDDASELQRQEHLLRIQQTLHDESAAKAGWDKNGDWFLDSNTGEWVQNYYNPQTGQSRQQRIKDVVPLSVIQAKMRGQNLPGPARVYATFFETQKNPATGVNYTPEEAQAKAAEHYTKYADVVAGLKAAQAKETLKSTEQRTSGTTPESPHEAATRQDSEENRKVQREQIWNTMDSAASEAEGNITGLQTKIASQQKIVEDLQNGFDGDKNDDAIVKNYSKGDPEYTAAENELNRQKRALADMQADLNGAQSKAKALRGKADSYKGTIGGTSGGGLTQAQQAAVNIVKANPKNKAALDGKSDVEIWALIQAQKNKK